MTNFDSTQQERIAEYGKNMIRDTFAWIMFKEGKRPSYSVGICGSVTAGYGKLDSNGYWEYSLPVNQKTLEIGI